MNFESYILNNNNNPHYTALYGWQRFLGDDTFTFGYISSYKEAADDLVDKCCPDLYLYPIMFCYRQYLELVLKNICYKNMNTVSYQNFISTASHNLSIVWNNAKQILVSQLENEQIDFINDAVMFFDKLDPSSFAFRYERDKKLNRSIKQDLSINTKHLKKCMDEVDLYLRLTYDSL